MRPLSDVITAIKTVIPEDFDKATLITELDSLASSVKYAAPEMQAFWWKKVVALLQEYLGTPDTPWKMEIAGIFAARIDYRKYLDT